MPLTRVTSDIITSGGASNGDVLTADGSGGTSFAAPAGGGAGSYEFIATSGALSGAAAVDFDSGITFSDYVGFMWQINARPSSATVDMFIRISVDGGATYNTGTQHAWLLNYADMDAGPVFNTQGANSVNRMYMTANPARAGTAGGDGYFMRLWAGDLNNAAHQTNFWWHGIAIDGTASGNYYMNGAARRNAALAINGVRIGIQTGTFENGEIIMYGIKNS